jgi:hypothetical protein
MKVALKVDSEILQDTYLGMPTKIARAVSSSFNFLHERAWRSATGWTDMPLSRAGKETFLKLVVQSISNYVMSCFWVLVGVCQKLKTIIVDQWWGFEDGCKKMHWRSWEWMSAPKSLGGMGFSNFVIFNQAMLGKQCWRLITESNSLSAWVLKGRYFPNSDFLLAKNTRSSSFTWRSILFGRELVVKGLRWGVGDGSRIKIMGDNWIPGLPSGTFSTLESLPANAPVSFLMNLQGNAWDI